MRGADKTIKDNKGKMPVDLIDDLKNAHIGLRNELRNALVSKGKCECLMLTNTLKKTEKSSTMPVLSMISFISIYIILVLFLFPGKNFNYF